MFRRRRHDEEPAVNLEPDGDEAEPPGDEAEPPADTAAAPHDGGGGGPWDAEESAPERKRVDFGALQVPIASGIEMQANVEAAEQDAEGNLTGGHIVALTIVHEDSGLQVQAFAAPKKSGIWDDIRRETAEEIGQAGGEAREAEGPFGVELHGTVPVAIPPEMMDQVPPEVAEQGVAWQQVRFLGVDGPRWFLRGVLSGAAVADDKQARVLEEIFRDIVIARGDQPMPPRELLELTFPPEPQQALDQDDDATDDDEDGGREPLNPFERGPEITEVR